MWTDFPICPTSARYGSPGFGVSLFGAGAGEFGVATAAGWGAGCADWVVFMLIGLLSSGRAFHISAPFLYSLLLDCRCCLTAATRKKLLLRTPVADRSGVSGLS